MKNTLQRYIILALMALGVSARADMLELKNGNVLNGKYAGGFAAIDQVRVHRLQLPP